MDFEKANKWVESQCTAENKKISQFIINNTVYISFDEFFITLNTAIDKFINAYERLLYLHVIIIPNEPEWQTKSNIWMTAYLIKYINDKKATINIIDIITPDTSWEKNKLYADKPNINYIYCDDVSYSGGQIYDYISDSSNITTTIIIPYVTNIMLRRFDGVEKCNIYYAYTMTPILEKPEFAKVFPDEDINVFNTKLTNIYGNNVRNGIVYKYNIENGNLLYYFAHKIADYVSSFPFIYESGIIQPNQTATLNESKCKTTQYIPFLNKCDNEEPPRAQQISNKEYQKYCIIPHYKKFTIELFQEY